jgi:aspartate ammonia-lyase
MERDALGEMELPDDSLYGIQSLRARDNFSLQYNKTKLRLIYAIVTVKKAAARTYERLFARDQGDHKGGRREIYRAIAAACDRVLAGEADDQFIVDALQGGAGTSTNMNVNEVIANMALRILGKPAGSYDLVHPLDDVNRGQSTNDVYPTGLRIAAIKLLRELSEGCAKLQESLQKKENEFDGIKKIGRTELMHALPITLGMEFGSYAQAAARDRWRIYKAEERLRQVNLGGAIVGVSGKETYDYKFRVIEELRSITGIGLAAAEYMIDCTQNQDVFAEVSGLLKALSVNLIKISTDLRLMNMPEIREVVLKPLQMGSTFLRGKVNPVIPEMTIQAAIKVQANDFAITNAASRGEFELNAFLPLIADMILESLELLNDTVRIFRENCVELITVPEI